MYGACIKRQLKIGSQIWLMLGVDPKILYSTILHQIVSPSHPPILIEFWKVLTISRLFSYGIALYYVRVSLPTTTWPTLWRHIRLPLYMLHVEHDNAIGLVRCALQTFYYARRTVNSDPLSFPISWALFCAKQRHINERLCASIYCKAIAHNFAHSYLIY